MAETQSTDPQIQALQSSPEAVPLANSSHPLYCNTSTGTQHSLVPKAELYRLSHTQGYKCLRSSTLLATYGPAASIPMFAIGHALVCKVNVRRYNTTYDLHCYPFLAPKACFQIVHVDLVGPLQSSRCFSYLLTCIDNFTRWPEAIPITNTTTEAVIQVFLNEWVSRFSVPSTIVTDHGRQFESHLWTNLMSFLLKGLSLAELCQPTL